MINSLDRILSCPLLEEEDEKGNEETNKVSFSKKHFLQTKGLTCFHFLEDGGLNLSELVPNLGILWMRATQVSQINECFLIPADRCQETGWFLRGYKWIWCARDPTLWLTLSVNRPKRRTPAGTSWKPKGILHIFGPVAIWIPIPTVMAWALVQDRRSWPTYNWWNMRASLQQQPIKIGEPTFQAREVASYHYLEATSDSATDFLGRALRDVRRCDSGYCSNPDTRYHSSRVDFA